MNNDEFMGELKAIFAELKNNHPKIRIEDSVKGMLPVLQILYFNESVTPKDLEVNLCVSSARIARVLNQLEEKGYVLRIQSEKDKRKTIVVLTDNGKAIAKRHKEEFDNYTSIMLRDISDSEKEEFVRLVRKMAENVKVVKKNV